MQTTQQNAELLKKALNLISTQLTREDFANAFKKVLEIVLKIERRNSDSIDLLERSYSQRLKELQDKGDISLDEVKKEATSIVNEAISKINARIAEIEKQDLKGDKGERGLQGERGIQGEQGLPGKDGSPDFAEDIRNKLEVLQGDERLDISAIKGAEDIQKDLKEIKIRPTGRMGGSKGFQLLVGGTKKIFTAQTLNLVAGVGISLTYAYANGRNDVTISAGAAALTILTATGTIDNSNTAFTFVSKPNVVIVNGASYRENNGWTWNGGTLTATLASPPGVGGDVYAL